MVFSLTSQNLEEFEQHFGCDNIGAGTYDTFQREVGQFEIDRNANASLVADVKI